MSAASATGTPRRQDAENACGVPAYEARDADFERRTRCDFESQGFMRTLGARLVRLAPGACALEADFAEALAQQHGFFHGGVIASLADVSGGYAAFSLLAAGQRNLTVEFKLNLVAPATGRTLLAEATVLKSGRTLSVCRSEVYSLTRSGSRKLCAVALATYMAVDAAFGSRGRARAS